METATRRQLVGLAVLVGVAGAAAAAFSPTVVLGKLQHLADHPVAFVAALLAAYLLRPLVAWPISALSVAVGYVWGVEAFPVALAGAVVTCVPPFLLARYAPTDGGLLGRVADTGVRVRAVTGDTRAVFAARLAPFPADVVSYGAGVASVPLGPYLLGTLLGEVPWTVAAVLLGASMQSLAIGEASPVAVVVGAAALAALVLAGPLYRHVVDEAGA